MKRIQLFALAAALMIAAACSDDISDVGGDISPTEPTSEQMPEVTFTPEEMGYLTELANGTPKISVDSAAKVALQVMGNRLSKSTLSVTAFGTPKAGSLSKSFFDSDIDTTLYVFNAPGGNGFAVISADARIPQQVLAYSEDGNLELDSDNPAFDVFLSYATDYAAECIAKAQEQRDSIENSILEKLGIELDQESTKSLSKKEVLCKVLLTNLCTKNTFVQIVSEVTPLIKTNWNQRTPYNDDCGHPASCSKGYAAGCVAIATSQLLTFWRYPSTIGGRFYLWDIIGNDVNKNDATYKKQVASLVRFVGNRLKTDYNCGHSYAKLKKVLPLMKKLDYSVPAHLCNYKYEKVVGSLNNGCPVLIQGYGSKKNYVVFNNYEDGHTWLIDGYVHQNIQTYSTLKYVVVERDDDGVISSHYEDGGSTYSVKTYKYLHFNWGWGDGNNGYYCQDVFHVGERYVVGNDGCYEHSKPRINENENYKYNIEIAVNIHK